MCSKQSFKYDRFLNEDRTVKNTFHKNGEQVRYHTLPWGAGRSSCVGKEFAVNAIKQYVQSSSTTFIYQFVFTLFCINKVNLPCSFSPSLCTHRFVFLILTHLDLELCDPEANLPPVNPSRYGYGMLQPEGDLQVRFRLKRILPEMWGVDVHTEELLKENEALLFLYI